MCVEPKQKYKYLLTKILEIFLTLKILWPPKIGGPRLKPFQPDDKSAPAPNTSQFTATCDFLIIFGPFFPACSPQNTYDSSIFPGLSGQVAEPA